MCIYAIIDIVSIIIIWLFIDRLYTVNEEYIIILERNVVKMSKFTIEIKGVKLDKTVQDMRMLKMKLWLHFSKVVRKFVNDDREQDAKITDPSDENISLSALESGEDLRDPFEDELCASDEDESF